MPAREIPLLPSIDPLCRAQVIAWCGTQSTTFAVVYREEPTSLPQGLDPFLLTREWVAEWPGTQLLGPDALRCAFRCTEQSAAVLVEMLETLWAPEGPFLSPEPRPEDLHLLRADGSVLFASITHEQEFWLSVSDAEAASLKATLSPEYRSLMSAF